MIELDLQHQHEAFKLRAQASMPERVIGLFGRSGSGKTTLMNLIAGLLRPTRGRIAVDGRVLVDSEQGIYLPPHQRQIGYVFQDTRLFPHYRVKGNLKYSQQLAKRREPLLSFEKVVELLELGPLLDRLPHALSGGEQQRVAIGRALLSAPKLLLLDEPLTGLDRTLKNQVLPYLQRVRDLANITMIYVSHDIGEVLTLTDHLMVLGQGTLLGAGAYRDLSLNPSVLPPLLETGLLNVLTLRVQAPPTDDGLAKLADKRGTVWHAPPAPIAACQANQSVTVRVRPEDIALASQRVEHVSIQNQLPGRVTRFLEHRGQTVVEVDVGEPLLVEISPASFKRMGLGVGTEVVCLIKANALQVQAQPQAM